MSIIYRRFDAEIKELRPTISAAGLEKTRLKELGSWMRNLALSGQIEDERIAQIALGPVTRRVQCYNMYDVRGFRFHTESYGKNRKTSNYGVCRCQRPKMSTKLSHNVHVYTILTKLANQKRTCAHVLLTILRQLNSRSMTTFW